MQILRFDTWEELLNFQDHRGTIINSVEEYSPLPTMHEKILSIIFRAVLHTPKCKLP